jgi:hypothetical protein
MQQASATATRVPGFTAARTVVPTRPTHASVAAAEPRPGAGSIVLQTCPVGVLGVCTPFLQACAGWCWWSRISGPSACTGCYTICLAAHFWWGPSGLCTPCVSPGGFGTNICA